jgi:hypothetical protein
VRAAKIRCYIRGNQLLQITVPEVETNTLSTLSENGQTTTSAEISAYVFAITTDNYEGMQAWARHPARFRVKVMGIDVDFEFNGSDPEMPYPAFPFDQALSRLHNFIKHTKNLVILKITWKLTWAFGFEGSRHNELVLKWEDILRNSNQWPALEYVIITLVPDWDFPGQCKEEQYVYWIHKSTSSHNTVLYDPRLVSPTHKRSSNLD